MLVCKFCIYFNTLKKKIDLLLLKNTFLSGRKYVPKTSMAISKSTGNFMGGLLSAAEARPSTQLPENPIVVRALDGRL